MSRFCAPELQLRKPCIRFRFAKVDKPGQAGIWREVLLFRPCLRSIVRLSRKRKTMADENPPAPTPPVPAAPPAPTPPPAAKIVNEGERTERELQLERDLEAERQARKKAETEAAYAQDEARRLKEVHKPKAKAKPPGWTLLHEAED